MWWLGKGMLEVRNFFFSVFSVSISDGKSQSWQYLIWLELSKYQIVNIQDIRDLIIYYILHSDPRSIYIARSIQKRE